MKKYKKHLSKEEKRLKKLEKKKHDYINTRMGIDAEYKKYNSISGKKNFSNEYSYEKYLENLEKSIDSIDNKIKLISKRIEELKKTIKKDIII